MFLAFLQVLASLHDCKLHPIIHDINENTDEIQKTSLKISFSW